MTDKLQKKLDELQAKVMVQTPRAELCDEVTLSGEQWRKLLNELQALINVAKAAQKIQSSDLAKASPINYSENHLELFEALKQLEES